MTYEAEERARIRRQRAEQAIQLAMQSKWEDAVQVNNAILALFPNDVDALNRLGKALSELGQLAEARDAYRRALEIDPTNTIAKRNLDRLASMAEGAARREGAKPLDPQLFIEEMGRTGVTTIQNIPPELLGRLSAGDPLNLVVRDNALVVESLEGEVLGTVEPKMGLRLQRLMEGGNRYAAAITSIFDSGCKVIIKETYQHPSQIGKPSFPPAAAGEAVRPYTKESLLRYDLDEDEEAAEEGEEGEDWEAEPEAVEPEARLFEAPAEVDEEFEE